MKKILTAILFLLFVVLVIKFWFTEQEKKQEVQFNQIVDPIVKEMKSYNELDLNFLVSEYVDLEPSFKKNPDQYITFVREEFRKTVLAYQESNPWELPLELFVEEILPSMSLEQKVAQLFIFWYNEIDQEEIEFLKKNQPGWIIVMWKNITSNLLEDVKQMQSTQKLLPLFVSIDQEWWVVARLEEDLPWQPYLSQEVICDVYKSRAKMLHDIWVNLNFWIVADVSYDTSSFIYPRVFQWDIPWKVGKAVECTHLTLSTIKHFPWHWWTTQDTHQGIKALLIEKTSREEADLKPFLSGIEAWSDLIMMWHLLTDFIDPTLPATLSKKTNDLLDSFWFTWLTITDDMWMISTDWDLFTQLEQALVAGNMLLYVNPENKQKILDHAVWFVRDGWLSVFELDAIVSKIIQKKQKIIEMDDYIEFDVLLD